MNRARVQAILEAILEGLAAGVAGGIIADGWRALAFTFLLVAVVELSPR